MSLDDLRVPPQSIDSERALIGSLLLAPHFLDEVQVTTDDFYHDPHQIIFGTICQMWDRGVRALDVVTIAEELVRKNLFDRAGGAPYLGEVMESVPHAAHIAYYAQHVIEASRKRRIIHACVSAMQGAYSGLLKSDEIVAELDRHVLQLQDIYGDKEVFTLSEAIQQLEYQEANPSSIFPTGINAVDRKLKKGGLKGGQMVIIAGRPGSGKSVLSGQIAKAFAERDEPSLIISLEMGKEEIAERYANTVDRDSLRGLPVYFTETVFSIERIRQQIKAEVRKHKIKCAVVDYLQLVEVKDTRKSRDQQVGEVSRGLKLLAKEAKIPIIVGCQLNRLSEKERRRPQLTDLRESGCLTGDTMICEASTGTYKPLRDIVASQSVVSVVSMTEDGKLRSSQISNAFSTGVKPVFKMTTASGKTIRATGNHQFRMFDGWKRLDELKVDDLIATPRSVPSFGSQSPLTDDQLAFIAHMIGDGCTLPTHAIQYTTPCRVLAGTVQALAESLFEVKCRIDGDEPNLVLFMQSVKHMTHGLRNPIGQWFEQLGIYGLRSQQKFIPDEVMQSDERQTKLFLKHLFATDGTISVSKGNVGIAYSTASPKLAFGVVSMLLKIGIIARSMNLKDKAGHEWTHIAVSSSRDQIRFLKEIGTIGYRQPRAEAALQILEGKRSNTNVDVIPIEGSRVVRKAIQNAGFTQREACKALGLAKSGSYWNRSMSFTWAQKIVDLTGDVELRKVCQADLFWDRIVSIVPDGEEEVFDLTVPGDACFVANNIIVHNSVEQDADIVMLLHDDPDTAEMQIVIGKQRGGETGVVPVVFDKKRTVFRDKDPSEGFKF